MLVGVGKSLCPLTGLPAAIRDERENKIRGACGYIFQCRTNVIISVVCQENSECHGVKFKVLLNVEV